MNEASLETPHGIWESIFVTVPYGRPYKDGHYETQCKCCHMEFPDHARDCEFDTLRKRLAAAERAIRQVLADEETGHWGPDVTMIAVLRATLAGEKKP